MPVLVTPELVARARGGDTGAFEELVRATYADAYALALRMTGDEHDARDAVQEAYLRAYRAIPRFRGEAAFSTWLYRITANCASSLLARRGRSLELELDMLSPPEGGARFTDHRAEHDPEARSLERSEHGRLAAALAELPPGLRAVVVLRDVYDLPHDAIACELGISTTAAKVRLHRARRQLRERLFVAAPGEGDAPRAADGEDSGALSHAI